MPRSTMLSTGSSGSATSASRAQPACTRAAAAPDSITAGIAFTSPLHARIAALQVLHFREHVTQVLGVHPAPAMPGVRLRRRPPQGRGGQILIDARRPARCEFRESGGDRGGLHAIIDVIGGGPIRGITPHAASSQLPTVVA